MVRIAAMNRSRAVVRSKHDAYRARRLRRERLEKLGRAGVVAMLGAAAVLAGIAFSLPHAS